MPRRNGNVRFRNRKRVKHRSKAHSPRLNLKNRLRIRALRERNAKRVERLRRAA